MIGPDATGLADFMVRRAAGLVDGLVVNAARMRQNLDLTGGPLLQRGGDADAGAQGDGAPGRPTSWCSATRCAPWPARGAFRELLGADPDIGARLTAAEIDRAFDLEHHLRHAGAIIDRALAEEHSHDQAIDETVIRAQLARRWRRPSFPELGEKYEGKVRDCYVRDGKRTLIATDRISAFDVVLGTIPFKGQVLNQMAAFWFEATADLVPNHVINVPDPAVTVARECKLLPVEFVMRAYITGRDVDVDLDALREGRAQLLRPRPARRACGRTSGCRKAILTPSTKAEKGEHDRSVSRARDPGDGRAVGRGLRRARPRCARACSRSGSRRRCAAASSWSTPSTRSAGAPTARSCFIDEVHTPDSSRYWYADDYEARFARGEEPRGLDKEYVRRTLADQGYRGDGPPPELADEVRVEAARRYIQVCELVTGRPFVPDTEEPSARIRRNLKL